MNMSFPAAAESGGQDCEEFIYDFWESYRRAVEKASLSVACNRTRSRL